MQSFLKLKVWQRSHKLALEMYRLTAAFPNTERFGLMTQIRRAATSVPTNIAEGSKRIHAADYARFLNVAEGSAAELSYLIVLARDLGMIGSPQADACLAELDELAHMLYAFRTKLLTADG